MAGAMPRSSWVFCAERLSVDRVSAPDAVRLPACRAPFLFRVAQLADRTVEARRAAQPWETNPAAARS
jgi:hypothetical protein